MFGVSAKQCRDHPRKKLPPVNFELLLKALRNPKDKSAKSRSRLGGFLKRSDITKVLEKPSKTTLLEILFEVSA